MVLADMYQTLVQHCNLFIVSALTNITSRSRRSSSKIPNGSNFSVNRKSPINPKYDICNSQHQIFCYIKILARLLIPTEFDISDILLAKHPTNQMLTHGRIGLKMWPLILIGRLSLKVDSELFVLYSLT